MSKYIMRLDDACEKMDTEKWGRMEALLDRYGIKPLVGIIPHCEDEMMNAYETDEAFWNKAAEWVKKGWTAALHGYNHVYSTECGGINPVQARSEFAGEPLDVQRRKIADGVNALRAKGIEPEVFYAPSHTFDENTLSALKSESNIRIISDTVANDVYADMGFTFVPQQSGAVRSLPFKTVTFCYHPNTMGDEAFERLEAFLRENGEKFIPFPTEQSKRRRNIFDKLLRKLYFARR